MEPEGREDSSGRRLSERWRLPALGSAGRRGLVGWGHPGFRFRWWLHLSIAFQVRTQTRADYQAVGHMPHHRALRPGSGLSFHAATGRMAGCVSLPSSAVGDGRGECSCEPRAAPRDRLHPCQRCDPCITWAEAHSPRQDCQRSRAAGSGAASRLPCKQGWTWRTCMVGSLVASPDAGCAFGAPGIPQGELHSFQERGGGLLEKLMNSPKALSALWTPRSFGAWRGQCGRAQQA